jgi:hypothetical protein
MCRPIRFVSYRPRHSQVLNPDEKASPGLKQAALKLADQDEVVAGQGFGVVSLRRQAEVLADQELFEQ